MRLVWKAAFVLGFSLPLFAAEKPDSTEKTPDVQTIVNKANIVAYYQGEDGKAKVKMTITSKRGQKRLREFNILRKDVTDGGDQNYFVYFQKPPDVRKMAYMVTSTPILRKMMIDGCICPHYLWSSESPAATNGPALSARTFCTRIFQAGAWRKILTS